MHSFHVLALDFDGVLHPGGDAIYINGGRDLPMWQVEIAMRVQGRFVWMQLLEQALDRSDVAIVIHSTWRRRFSDAQLKQLLSPELARRVVNLDGQISCRNDGTSEEYLMEAMSVLQPDSLLVLDDRPDFFSQGLIRSWLDSAHGEMVWVDPNRGLTTPGVQCRIASWAAGAIPGNDPLHEAHVGFNSINS